MAAKVVEPAYAVKAFPQDQKAPRIVDRRHGAGDGARAHAFQQDKRHVTVLAVFLRPRRRRTRMPASPRGKANLLRLDRFVAGGTDDGALQGLSSNPVL